MRPTIRHDAADLAATLRALAARAHEAVKATGDRAEGPIRHELADLRNAIAQLEDDFRSQHLDTVIPYVVRPPSAGRSKTRLTRPLTVIAPEETAGTPQSVPGECSPGTLSLFTASPRCDQRVFMSYGPTRCGYGDSHHGAGARPILKHFLEPGLPDGGVLGLFFLTIV